MGSLFIQVGQCGCQIGAKFNPLLSNSYYCTRNRPPYRLHTIMIDTEPKVLRSYEQKPPKWLDLDNIKYFEHGRGNNWSYGYLHDIPSKKINTQILADYKQFSHKDGNKLLQTYIEENKKISQFVLERVRKQLQTVDAALAINVISSLGGGTGSGLGTKTIQKISQEFNIQIFSHVVLPNMSGQTPLQVYNCLLSLSVIQQHSTAIFPIQNDKYLEYYRQKNKEYFNIDSLDSINSQIAQNMSKFIKINDIQGYDRFYTMIANDHVLSNQLKYLTLISADSIAKVDPWNECFQQFLEKIKIFNSDYSPNQSMNRRQCLLSGQIITISQEPVQYEKKYKKKLQSSLNPLQISLEFSQIFTNGTKQISLIEIQKDLLNKKQKSSTKDSHEALLIMNHSNITRYLSYLCQQGTLKYENKAYLWHYEYVDIQQSLQNIQQTLDQYNMYTYGKI